MKKVILSSLLLGSIMAAKSQNLSLGPVVGLNHSWMTNAGNDVHFNPGLNVGGTLTYSFHPGWGVGADLLYTMNGVKHKTMVNGITTTRDAGLDFVRFQPKIIRFFNNLGDAVRPKLYAGVSLGVLTGGNVKTMVGNNDETTEVTSKQKSKDLYNSFDAGVFAGTGINFRIGRATWLNTDIVYNNGLVDLSKSNNNWSANRSVAFNVGITFPIGTVTPQ